MQDGILSPRRGNTEGWRAPILGKAPYGNWKFMSLNELNVKKLFEEGVIEDILLVITYFRYHTGMASLDYGHLRFARAADQHAGRKHRMSAAVTMRRRNK